MSPASDLTSPTTSLASLRTVVLPCAVAVSAPLILFAPWTSIPPFVAVRVVVPSTARTPAAACEILPFATPPAVTSRFPLAVTLPRTRLFLSFIVTSFASTMLTTFALPALSKSLASLPSMTSYLVVPLAAVKFATPCASTYCVCVMLPLATISRDLPEAVCCTPSRTSALLLRNSIPPAVAPSLLTSLAIFTVGSSGSSAVVTSTAVTVSLSPLTFPSDIVFASARDICEAAPPSTATVPVKSLFALFTVTFCGAVNVAFSVRIWLAMLMSFVTEISTSPAITGVEGSVVKSPVRSSLPAAEASKPPLRAISTMESVLAPEGAPAHVVSVALLFALSFAPGLSLKPRWRAST